MPSNRRFRVYGIIAVVLFLAFLFFSGPVRRSDRSFYDRSVAGMERARSKTPGAEPSPSPRIPPPAPDAKDGSRAKEEARPQKAGAESPSNDETLAAGRQPPQVALGEDGDSKRVKGSERWGVDTDESKEKAKENKTPEQQEVEAELNRILKRSPIIIFSKTYCPFSKKAKQIFSLYSITPAPFIVELDEHTLGQQLQDQLQKLTGRRTVPNILISGSSIGGGDDVGLLHEKGELVKKIKDTGGKRIMEARLKGVKEKD